MTDVKITGLTISGDSIIIDYSGGGPSPDIFKYYTPNDIISNYNINEIVPPATCNKTKYSAESISMLDLTRAWVDAGNTKETAKFVLLIAGGEAIQTRSNNPGTYTNTAPTGIIQCDSCSKYKGVNNTNICHNIWAATRLVLIPKLNPSIEPDKNNNNGCIFMKDKNMDTNICNSTPTIRGCLWGQYSPNGPAEFNYIGPFCHDSINEGTAWSSADNFPNNYYRQFLGSITNGNFTSIDNLGCITGDGTFANLLKPCYKKINVPDKVLDFDISKIEYDTSKASKTNNCSYKSAKVVESISQQIVDCALDNPDITNILDCPTKLKGINHNICYLYGCASKTEQNCNRQLKGTSYIDYTDIIPGNILAYNSDKNICYGGPSSCPA